MVNGPCIALAQLDLLVGDVQGNLDRVRAAGIDPGPHLPIKKLSQADRIRSNLSFLFNSIFKFFHSVEECSTSNCLWSLNI